MKSRHHGSSRMPLLVACDWEQTRKERLWLNVLEHSHPVSLCNKSGVQQRKTKEMWTDNILMGGIKECKWSMEAAAKWCPGGRLWCGRPQRDTAGYNALFERHAEWQTLPSLAVSPPPPPVSLPPSPLITELTPHPVTSCYIPPLRFHISPYPYRSNFLPLPLPLISSNNTPLPAARPLVPFASPFTGANLFVMSSLGKLRPICCPGLNEFICLCIGPCMGASLPPLPRLLSSPPPFWCSPGHSIYTGQQSGGTYYSSTYISRQMRRVTDDQKEGESLLRRLQPGHGQASAGQHHLGILSGIAKCLPGCRHWTARVLTACSYSYRCSSQARAVYWQLPQAEKSTGCLRVHSKVNLFRFCPLQTFKSQAEKKKNVDTGNCWYCWYWHVSGNLS